MSTDVLETTSAPPAVPNSKPRDAVDIYSQRLSLARLILIVLVVYVHFPLEVPSVRSLGMIGWLEPAFIANATFLRFSVTILTIMSGFIMFAKHADERGMATINKKVRTLLVPFLFWNLSLVAALYLAQRLGILSGQRLNLLTADAQTWADATLAWSTRPVNYPLYFLRDLFVISVIAVVASRLVRAQVIAIIAICVLVAEYNLDGNLILRTPMLIAFFMGAALAIYQVKLDVLDRGLPYFAALLVVACVVHYYYPSANSGLLLSILGGLTMWTLTALVHSSSTLQGLARFAKFAFPIYLIHGIILFGVLALGVEVSNSPLGLALWLLLPLIIAVVSALLFRLFSLVLPKFASFTTGGRGA
ncbi:acyltransferase family protein [uncultured Devosia sp.]|uniref:acyltransferase family protein n=1 Tax=uncultured Devosia sp. TaxID=211434 RepID=UPI0035C98C7D